MTRTLPPLALGKVYSYPNPFVPGAGRLLNIRFDPNPAAGVEIWDWSGQRRCVLAASQVFGTQGLALWDGKVQDGQPAAPGVYFAVVKATGGDKMVKLTVVWP